MNEKFTDWMNRGRVKDARRLTERLMLADGSSLSIQASDGHYCGPRCDMDGYEQYYQFEVGFPSVHMAELEPYKDRQEAQTASVFGYVPLRVIEELIKARGGVVGFHLPDPAA